MSEVKAVAGALAILAVGIAVIVCGAAGFYGFQQFLFAQGLPAPLAVGIPLAAFLTLAAWAYWRTFQIMRRA